jgi:CBS domain containing-hemolysin-like protein
MTVLLVVAALLLLASALLSAAETAAFSPGESTLRTLQEEGFKGADALVRLREDPSAAHLTLGVVESFLNILVTASAVYVGVIQWGHLGLLPGILVALVTVLVLGEVIPRAIARRRPVRLGLAAAPALLALERLVAPILAPLSRLEKSIVSVGVDPEERSDQERTIEEITDLGRREGIVGDDENQLVERAFRLDELTAWDAMTPRVEIFALEDSLTLREIVDDLAAVPYSRVPVWAESVDDITGILHVREAYENFVAGRTEIPLSAIAREPIFIPSSMSLTRCLRLFQLRRIHMGIVADEFGGTDGLITLEDVVEELVGEIEDETDLPEVSLIRISRGEALADASIDLREINKAMNASLPLEEHRSLNGLILEQLGRVPEAGDVLEIENLRVEVVEATETQVRRVRITGPSPDGTAGKD